MAVSADSLRVHLDYHAWASRRLLEAVAQLTPEEQSRDFQTSSGNVVKTLAHVFGADRVWFERIRGQSPTAFMRPEEYQLEFITSEWPEILENWKQRFAAASDQDVDARISYRDLSGNAWAQPLWQIVLHVVNHGTHHRGQVSGFLRAMGHQPPPLDLIAFYRTL